MNRIIQPESGKYRLNQMLGEGLSSIVYRAERTDSRNHSQQTIALKILKSEKDVQILKGEFQALLRVKSPHCVSVLGWENFPQGSALVLEYVSGVSLDTIWRHFPFSRDLIDDLSWQIQLGLQDLNREGLCHGDLSPSNILVDEQGRVKLVDFGLACCPDRAQLGTLEYLAPERWKNAPPDYLCDLYALGLMRMKFAKDLPTEEKQRSDESLLCIDRSLRAPMSNLEPKPQAREELSRWIRQYVKTQAQRRVVTQVLSAQPDERPLSRKIQTSLIATILATSLFLFPRFPHGESSPLSRPASLHIRARNWLQISIDHQNYGFAPIDVPIAYPGVYRLRWRSAHGSGKMVLRLKSGEQRQLTEASFR